MPSPIPLSRPGLFRYRVYDWLRHTSAFLRTRHPLNGGSELQPFFIIGSGRSGMTLMRAILMSGSAVAIPPESHVLPRVIRRYSAFNYLKWDELCQVVIAQFAAAEHFEFWDTRLGPAYAAAVALPPGRRDLAGLIDVIYRCYMRTVRPGAEVWGDKTPSNTRYLQWLHRVYPQARYIHMLRDGRDVVSSFMNSGLKHDVSSACNNWMVRVREARYFGLRHPDRFLEIRYEDLVKDSARVVPQVCEFLQVPFEDTMLAHQEKVACLADVGQLAHMKNVQNPISTASIGRWRNDLSKHDINYVEHRLHPHLSHLGYV